jgi:hypothetical protein
MNQQNKLQWKMNIKNASHREKNNSFMEKKWHLLVTTCLCCHVVGLRRGLLGQE